MKSCFINIKVTFKLCQVVEMNPYLIMKCLILSIKILEYKFQALWLYEMAFKFPFLYEYKKKIDIIRKCVETFEDTIFTFCRKLA